MIFHDDALHEVLVDDFAVALPDLTIVRYEHVVASSDQIVGDVAVRAVAVNA